MMSASESTPTLSSWLLFSASRNAQHLFRIRKNG
jgi:hypothetical protein